MIITNRNLLRRWLEGGPDYSLVFHICQKDLKPTQRSYGKLSVQGGLERQELDIQEVSCEADVMQVRNGVFHFLELM